MKIILLFKRYMLFARKVKFMALRDGYKRADYLRKNQLLASIGEQVYYYSRIFPSDPKLLRIGNNVVICTAVRFVNHDRTDIMLSNIFQKNYSKYYAPIQVEDNVFIGSDVVVLPGVKIGKNTIIGAGAVVAEDLPSGFVWGGVPAVKIGSFQDFIEKRKTDIFLENDPDKLWAAFYQHKENV